MTDRTGTGMRSRNNASRPRQGVASRELQEARRRKRQREVMRNRIIFGACVLLIFAIIVFFIVKLVGFALNSNKTAESSTLTFTDSGSVVFEEIADFDTSTYSKSELKDYTKDLIDSFNETYGEEAIVLNKFSVKGDKAYIKTSYKDAQCYSEFTSYVTYNGSYEDAVEQGYDFSQLYSAVNDGALSQLELMDADTLFASSKVAIVEENIIVNVPGTIEYVSNANIELIDEDSIAISQADGNEDATDLVFIIYN